MLNCFINQGNDRHIMVRQKAAKTQNIGFKSQMTDFLKNNNKSGLLDMKYAIIFATGKENIKEVC